MSEPTTPLSEDQGPSGVKSNIQPTPESSGYKTKTSLNETTASELAAQLLSIQNSLDLLSLRIPTASSTPDKPPETISNPQISIKDAVEFVPTFNGQNISVLQFSRACKRAKSMVSPYVEPQLVKFLQNKLQGHAYLAIEDRTFSSVDELISRLKNVFSPAKSTNQYRGELANITKLPSENILDYIGRVKDLRSAILEGEQDRYTTFFPQLAITINELTLESFLNGLPPEIRVQMNILGYRTLDQAFDTAITAAKQVESDRIRFHGAPAPSQTASVVCQICNKPNHTASQCWHLNSARQNKPPQNNSNRPFNPQQLFCNYCKSNGHTISQCRIRPVNNTHRDSGNAQQSPSQPDERRGHAIYHLSPTNQPESTTTEFTSQSKE